MFFLSFFLSFFDLVILIKTLWTNNDNLFYSKAEKTQDVSSGSVILKNIAYQKNLPIFFPDEVEAELLHTYSRIDPYDTLILCVRVAVLTAVTLTVPIVLFPVSLH